MEMTGGHNRFSSLSLTGVRRGLAMAALLLSGMAVSAQGVMFDFVIPKGEQGPPGDKGEPGGDAANTNFDDTTAGLGVTNVQEAIELLARSISRAIIVSGKS